MKNLFSSSHLWALCGATALAQTAPVLAQNYPSSQAPAYGRRDRDERRDDRRDDRNRGGWDNDDTNNYYGTTLLGVVTRDFAGDRFELRADDGRIFTVRADNEPSRLNAGDRVQIQGRFDNSNSFRADSVRVVNNTNGGYNGGNYNGNYNYGQTVDFSATITRTFGSSYYGARDFEVRGDNGAVYRVQTSYALPANAVVGTRVRLIGSWSNRVVYAQTISVLSSAPPGTVTVPGGYNNGGYYGGGYNNGYQTVDFPALISWIDARNGRAGVRGDNGVTYEIRTSSLWNFRVGERVRVVGTFGSGVINVSSLNRI